MEQLYRDLLGGTSSGAVFYHDLLITKLHHIDYKNYTDAYMIQKIGFVASRKSNYLDERATTSPYVKKYLGGAR